jgi:NADH:ubiquinone oxidoreductase subunit E
MNATLAKPHRKRLQAVLEHASGDKRFKILEVHMKRYQFRHDSLIEVLHKAQELFGYLEDDLLLFVSYKLKLPPSRVYGVATFYHFFTLKPQGEHTCVVCMGTACYVKGADKVIAAVQEHLRIKSGEDDSGQQGLAAHRTLHRREGRRAGVPEWVCDWIKGKSMTAVIMPDGPKKSSPPFRNICESNPAKTTADNKVSLLTARCIGARGGGRAFRNGSAIGSRAKA